MARGPSAPERAPAVGPIQIDPGERVILIGQTQMGKSTLANHIVHAWDRAVVLETKDHDGDLLPNSAVVHDAAAAVKALPGRVIYRPTREDMRDLLGAWDRIADRVIVLARAGVVVPVLIHELRDIADGGGLPRGSATSELFRKGASMRIPVVVCAQRPTDIPRDAVSEATHVFVFYLRDPKDIARAAEFSGPQVREDPISEPYEFWYAPIRGPLRRASLSL